MSSDETPGPGGPPVPLPGHDMDWETLARYFAGESPEEERARVRAWLEARPAEAGRLERLHAESARVAAAAIPAVDVEAALDRVKDRMRSAPTRPVPAEWRRPVWMVPALMAAAAATFVFVGTRLSSDRQGPADEFRVVLETGIGQRDSLRLADGTLVVLGPASRLSAGPGYGRAQRAVVLEGTGYFVVTHDARPFTVRAGTVVVRDIGTAFTIRAHGEIEVVVTEGAVAVASAGGPEAILAAGDVARVTQEGRASVERQVATAADTAWLQGRLVFRDTPLPRVAEDLGRWYGGTIRLADPRLAGRRLTAELHGETRAEALRIVELALGVRIETHGDTSVVHTAGGEPVR